MPDELQVFLFEINGRAEIRVRQKPGVPVSRADDREINREILFHLNEEAEVIAREIETEIRSVLPPYFSVRADIQFYEGSILIAGTILVLSWVGSTAAEVAREELKNQLSSVIKISIQRVFSRFISPARLPFPISTTQPPNINVTSLQGNQSTASSQGTQSSITSQDIATGASLISKAQSPSSQTWYLRLILATLLLLLLFNAFTWFDQNYVITQRNVSPSVPTITATVPSSSPTP